MEVHSAERLEPSARALFAALLVATFLLRAVHPDQPIVENYVGRQVPTAMVARNLERGSGFGFPQLDTAPLPNLFLVEPPIYAQTVVVLRAITGMALEPAGRWVSALGITLGAWGLFGLVRRRAGTRTALIAVAALAVFPVTIRYGRAFQPDALMLGTLLAGLRCWDEREAGGPPAWLAAGWLLLAISLAIKVTAAYVLVPLWFVLVRPPRLRKLALVLSTLAPALLWYAYAAWRLGHGEGSRAAADNGAIWLRTLVPDALFRAATLRHIVRFTVVRAFTPLGFVLAGMGLCRCIQPRWGSSWPGSDSADEMARPYRLWTVWGLAATAGLLAVAAKLHHEYYWLALAPLAAVGVGSSLDAIGSRSRGGAVVLGVGLIMISLIQSSSTWRTPAEWSSLSEAARAVQAKVSEDAWIVAPEALLYAADRRGCRLELSRAAALRAAGEWGATDLPAGPLALVEFYRNHGARFVADVAGTGDPERLALHEAIRARYNVLVDTPGVLLAALTDRPELSEDADASH